MLQSISRTHAAGEEQVRTSLSGVPHNANQNTSTTLRVKMKVVKKKRANKSDAHSEKISVVSSQKDQTNAALLIPTDERQRRRLSDSMKLEKRATPQARRRSVSFDPFTVLKTAILENDVDGARNVLISGKVSANTSLDGVLPLVLAAREGCAECLELLIENGANIDVRDKRGISPLELAVQGGHFDCAQLLIAAGANANSIRDGYFDESIESGRHSENARNRSRTF